MFDRSSCARTPDLGLSVRRLSLSLLVVDLLNLGQVALPVLGNALLRLQHGLQVGDHAALELFGARDVEPLHLFFHHSGDLVEVVLVHLNLTLLLRYLLPEDGHAVRLADQLGLGFRLALLRQRRRRVLPLLPRLDPFL